MLETFTFGGEVIRLFRTECQWGREHPIRVEHRLRTIKTESLTGRENRSAAFETIRHRMTCPYILRADQADRLRNILGQYSHSRVAIPLWPGVATRSTYVHAVYQADWLLNYGPGGFEVRPSEQLGVFEREYVVPLIVGYLDPRPKLQPLTDNLARVSVTIVEDSPYELHIRPNVDGMTFGNVFPSTLRPDWSKQVDTVVDILDYTESPRGRERMVQGEDAPPKWSQEAQFQLSNQEQLRTALGYFANRRGRYHKFETPWWFQPGPDRSTTPHETVARFGADTLTVDYLTNGFGATTLRFHQLPWEKLGYVAERPNKHYLVEFTYKVPGEVRWHFTTHERDVVENRGTTEEVRWNRNDSLRVNRPKQGLGIDKEVWSFSVYRSDDGVVVNPLNLTVPFGLEGELEVRVYESTPEAPEAKTLEFVGFVQPEGAEGKEIRFSANSFTGALDRKVPAFRLQRRCNYQVFPPDGQPDPCGLRKADWRRQVTIVAREGASVTVSGLDSRDYNQGRLYGGSGLGYESRPILGQNGSRLDILKPLKHLDVGDVVYLLPSCDGTPDSCQAYGNYPRFGGHPFIPAGNPSIQPVDGEQMEVGKK